MRINHIERYNLIINKLQNGSFTYFDIERYLVNSNEFERIDRDSYSIRTLQRDIIEIESIYDISIKCKQGKYYIDSDENILDIEIKKLELKYNIKINYVQM